MGGPDDSGVVPIGSLLDGRYRVEAILGRGGMGRVYKAEHTSLGRAVAIKVLHTRLGSSKEAAQRFQREAKASGRLDHPNIVAVSDFGALEDGSLFLVMEALEGEPLGSRLEREKRIPWQEALAIIRGVLSGLAHAHAKGIVHRDIKPDNIFLAKKGDEQVVKILDFGIAKVIAGNADDPATTRAGLTVGTPAYLSPEQAVGGTITGASDLYSTSIVLYEMLTGRPPFLDQEPLAMLTAHVSRDVPPFSEVAPDLQVPPGLEAVIHAGLQKISAERTSSAIDYMQRLDEVARAAGFDFGGVPRPSGQFSISTPARGVATTPHPYSTPTPMPFASEIGTAPTLGTMPQAAQRVSLHDIKEPLPQKYKVIAILIVLGAAFAALYFFTRASDNAHPTQIISVPTADNATRLKAALHDLETGKTCADRKTAIPTLVEIGGDEAIRALKRARFRGRGGVLGLGESNANACLKSDAELAIQKLQGNN